MTTAPGFAQHPEETMLAELSTLIGVRQGIGAQEDSEHTSADRGVWIPGPLQPVGIRHQPSDGEAVAELRRRYQVSLYADSYPALLELYQALYRAMDALLTRKGFEVSEATPAPRGGLGGAGWGVIVPVTIKGPIYREVLGTVTPTAASVSLTATDPAGQNGEALS